MTPDKHKYRFHGRRKSRALRIHKHYLMNNVLSSLEFRSISDLDKKMPIWLEIGFGGGEHLAIMAERHPNVQFIGCEIFKNGVASLLQYITDTPLKNISIYSEDVRPFIKSLPDHCIDMIFIMFPDPWPKKKHLKRRLLNQEMLNDLMRISTPMSGLRFASDHHDYIQNVGTLLKETPFFEKIIIHDTKPDDWPCTVYNQKAILKGAPSWYLEAWRNECSHIKFNFATIHR